MSTTKSKFFTGYLVIEDVLYFHTNYKSKDIGIWYLGKHCKRVETLDICRDPCLHKLERKEEDVVNLFNSRLSWFFFSLIITITKFSIPIGYQLSWFQH